MIALTLLPKWRIFIITYCVYAVVYITRKSFSVVKTLIQVDLGLTTKTLGLIDTAFLSSYALCQVFLPSVSDIVGIRPVLIVSLACAAVFSLTFSVSYSSPALISSWFLEGVAHAPIFSVLVKSISMTFQQSERGTVLGVWTTSQQTGAIVATSLVTFISATFGWRAAFTLAGIVTAGASLVVYRTLPEMRCPPLPLQYSHPQWMSAEEEKRVVEDSSINRDTKRCVGAEMVSVSIGKTKPKKKNRFSPISGDRRQMFATTTTTEEEESEDDDDDGGGDEGRCAGHDSQSIRTTNLNQSSGDGNNQRGFQREVVPESPIKPSSAVASQSSSRASSVSSPYIETHHAPMKFWDVLRIPNLISCGISYFCVKFVRYTLLFWLPYFLITEMGFETSLAGYSSLLFDIGGIFGAISSGFIADRMFHGRRMSTSSAMCVGAAIMLALLAQVSIQPPPLPAVVAPERHDIGVTISQSILDAWAKESIPSAKESIPSAKESIPSAKESIPSAKESIPSAKESIPSAKESIPSARESIPSAKESIPSAKESIPSSQKSTHEEVAFDAAPVTRVVPPLSVQPDDPLAHQTPSSPTTKDQPSSHSSTSEGLLHAGLGFLARRDSQQQGELGNSKDRLLTPTPRARKLQVFEPQPRGYKGTLILVTLIGFFIAGPDSILGATSAGEMCNRAKHAPSAQASLSTATGIVNGLGAFGGVAQGYLTAVISEAWGWTVLFLVLAAACLVSVLALWQCVTDDWTVVTTTSLMGDRSSGRYVSILTSKKDTKSIR